MRKIHTYVSMYTSIIITISNCISYSQCMHDLESEWPAHNQGKTLGWKAREKTQYKTPLIHYIVT